MVRDEKWEMRLDAAAAVYPHWLATQESFPAWANTPSLKGFILYERGYAWEDVPEAMRGGWMAAAQAEAVADWAAEAEEEVVGADVTTPAWW